MSIDYLQRVLDVFKEAFTFKKYKKMPVALAIFVGIAVSPFVVMSLCLALSYIMSAFMFKFLSSPIEFYMNFIRGEGKDVKHATQAVIYFIGFPFSVLFHIIICFLVLELFILFFMIACLVKVWSLCGVSTSVFVNDNPNKVTVKNNLIPMVLPIVQVSVFYGLILVGTIMCLASRNGYYNYGYYYVSISTWYQIGLYTIAAAFIFNFAYSLIAYRNSAKTPVKAVSSKNSDRIIEAQKLYDDGVISEQIYKDLLDKYSKEL